jgi:hypothetical protein
VKSAYCLVLGLPPVGTGAAVEIMGKEPNPFLATVGLRVEPAPAGSGVTVPAGGRVRVDAVRVLPDGRGDRAGHAAPGDPRQVRRRVPGAREAG